MIKFRTPPRAPRKFIDPPSEQYQHIHDAADDFSDDLAQAFVTAAGESVTYSALYDAVGTGDYTRVNGTIDMTPFFAGYSVAHADLLGMSASTAYATSITSDLAGAAVEGVNPYAVRWAQMHSATAVTRINELTRLGIRQAVVSTLSADMSRAEQVRHIKGMIGLTPRYVTAVNNYRAELVKQGLSKARIAELVKAKREKYLWLRATMIADTELMMAANMGQYLLWEQAAYQGLLLASEWLRIWIVTPDDRLCQDCLAMEGQTVELLKMNFQGEVNNQPVSVLVPPLHTKCRCTTGLIRA